MQDISPTGIAGQFTFPRCEFGGSLFFVADDGSHGQEPWITNGTYAQMIADIQSPGSSAPWGGAEFSGFLFFTAQTAAHGAELWMSDAGTATTEVADIWPGATGSSPHSVQFAARHRLEPGAVRTMSPRSLSIRSTASRKARARW